LQQLVGVFRTRLSAVLGNSMLYDLRASMYEKLQGLSLSFFDKQQTGALVARVNQDTAELQRFMADFFPVTLESLLLLIGAGIFLFIFNWQLTLMITLPLMASVLFLKKMFKRMGAYYRNYFERRSRLSAQVNEGISGIRVVKVFGQETTEIAKFNEKSNAYREAGIELVRQTSLYSPAFSIIIILASSAVWMAGGELVLLKKMTLGSIIAFLGYLAMFYRPVMTLGQLVGTVASSLSAAQRVFEIFDARPEVVDAHDARSVIAMKGKIELRDVSVAYGGVLAVSACNCVIEPGSRVAFVGKSGAGKSTIANAICRLYDVSGGAVLIDDSDIRTIKIEDVRRRIGLIPQETFLFDGPIYDNIAYAKPTASKDEVIAAAKIAGAHDFITAKPGGYDALAGERGVMLSGGEKQRIAIARAVLHDPAILVLDEATSAVDTVTENEVLAALDRLPGARTVICIAHRLSVPERYEKVFVMDRGSIAETGTHAQLMAKKGLYYEMFGPHDVS
jgi:ATP-binding cassette subfamily B protein